MEFLFLGTGAADWCLEDQEDFKRRHSAALVNSDLMIDCGKHIFDFAESIGKKDLYDKVTDIIITHAHGDHFSKESVLKIAEKRKIRLGGEKRVLEEVGEHQNIEPIRFEPFKTLEFGDYVITPILANHGCVSVGEKYAFHYIIETGCGKKIFYGLDGAWFLRPSWEEMKKHKFDIMVFDCTVGDMDDWRMFEHNTIPMLRTMIKEIKNQEMVKEGGKLLASHLARSLHKSHEDTERILNDINMLTAYDGLKLVL